MRRLKLWRTCHTRTEIGAREPKTICGHSVALNADCWPDESRLSDVEPALLLAPALSSSIEIDDHRECGAYSQDANAARNQQTRHHWISISTASGVGNSRMISARNKTASI
jgi:hypothetical protein